MAEFDIHRASESERLIAYRNSHEVWGGTLTPDDYVKQSRESVVHESAEGWALTAAGELASALLCLPIEFRLEGRIVPGFAIGAVHTAPKHRKRGYAAALCQRVAETMREANRPIGLLFTNIDPDYYAKLGYRLCPAWDYTLCEAPAHRSAVELIPFDGENHVEELFRRYAEAHEAAPLSLWRSLDYWAYNLAKNKTSRFCWIVECGGRVGYFRYRIDGETMTILELVVAPGHDQGEALHAAGILARDLSLAAVSGWLQPHPAVEAHCSRQQRAMRIPMLSVGDCDISDSALASCHFWRSDHF